jgi:hypothetical protein
VCWSANVSWCINISQAIAIELVLLHLQLDMCSVLLNRDHSQLYKDSLPCSVKTFSAPTISRPLLLVVRMFKGPKLPKTYCKLVLGASTVGKMDIIPTNAPTRAVVLISPLHLHLPLPVELCSWESQPYCCGGSPGSS